MVQPISGAIETAPHVPTSVLLESLIQEAPTDRVTLGWLMAHLRSRSFGMILFLLGVCGLLPVVSPAAGLLLAAPAYQVIRAHPMPMFPQRVLERAVETAKLAAMLRRIIPALRYLERLPDLAAPRPSRPLSG